jgi:hypothetical protein
MPARQGRQRKKKMANSFTREGIEKAGENLLWAQGIINYVLRTGGDLEEAETLSIFNVLSMLLDDAVNIFDPLNTRVLFPQLEANEEKEARANPIPPTKLPTSLSVRGQFRICWPC